jgi:hypothetical protein
MSITILPVTSKHASNEPRGAKNELALGVLRRFTRLLQAVLLALLAASIASKQSSAL